jgi:hypothetical protein
MNVVFWLLIIIALVAFWFMACILFKPLGSFISKIFNDAVECLDIEETKNEGENEK